MRVAVDVGYGWTKAVAEDGGRVSFPSVLAPYSSPGGSLSEFGFRGEGQVVTVGGVEQNETYLFGNDALHNRAAFRPWDSRASERKGYDLLLYAALAHLMPMGGEVDLSLGLPMGEFEIQQMDLKVRFRGSSTFVAIGSLLPVPFTIRKVVVLPQAMGAFLAMATDPSIGKGPYLVVDVGMRTTDFFVVERRQDGLHARKDISDSLEMGCAAFYDMVQAAAQEMTGAILSRERDVEVAIEDGGVLSHRGRQYDLVPAIERSKSRIGTLITSQVRERIGDEWDRMGAVLVVGGGADLVRESITKAHSNVLTPQDPVFANAQGFLSVLGAAHLA